MGASVAKNMPGLACAPHGNNKRWLLLMALCLVSSSARSVDEPGKGKIAEIWITPGVYSYHLDRSTNYRENNIGIGAEVWLTDHHAVTIGKFLNSDNDRSRYLAYQWRPVSWQPNGFRFSAGVNLGFFDGYRHYRNGAWFPAALPMLTADYKQIGLNILLIPTIPNRLEGAIAVQLKIRAW